MFEKYRDSPKKILTVDRPLLVGKSQFICVRDAWARMVRKQCLYLWKHASRCSI